jgi:cell division protein FtsA
MEEILEHVYYEIKNSGYEKKLIAGIVVTGGGAQLKYLPQLVEYITGMDTRIGHPNEHLVTGAYDLSHPLYATGAGLVMKGFDELLKDDAKQELNSINVKPTIEVVQHSKQQKKKAGFMEKIFSGASRFFDEDVEGERKNQ